MPNSAAPVIAIPTVAMPAWTALQDAIDEHGSTPCRGRLEWISGDPGDREYAMWQCQRCPVINQCAEYADKAKERGNVWAGIDRSAKLGRPPAQSPLFDIESQEAS